MLLLVGGQATERGGATPPELRNNTNSVNGGSAEGQGDKNLQVKVAKHLKDKGRQILHVSRVQRRHLEELALQRKRIDSKGAPATSTSTTLLGNSNPSALNRKRSGGGTKSTTPVGKRILNPWSFSFSINNSCAPDPPLKPSSNNQNSAERLLKSKNAQEYSLK